MTTATLTSAPRTSAFWHCQADMSAVNQDRLVFVRGEGSHLWDRDGNKYFDGPASLWYCNIGHGRGEIADAVAQQIRRLESYSSFGRFTTDVTLELADRVASLLPIRNAKILLTSGGSDGIDLAAKLVRRYWSAVGRPGKTGIVTRDLAYHGLHAYGTSITGILANQDGIGKLVSDVHTVPTHDLTALAALFAEHGDRIGAFFSEPVMGTGGVIAPEPGYFAEVRRLCDAHDILLVADEVITGFGRLGEWFGSTVVGIDRPDLIVMAKGISSGYQPLGAVAVSERVAEPFWGPESVPFRHGMTYAGHSSACAAAMANLDIIESENLLDRVRQMSTVLADSVGRLAGADGVLEVRAGVGLMAGVQLTSAALAARVADRCLADGVIARPITNGTLQFSPPFVASADDVNLMAAAVERNIAAALADDEEK